MGSDFSKFYGSLFGFFIRIRFSMSFDIIFVILVNFFVIWLKTHPSGYAILDYVNNHTDTASMFLKCNITDNWLQLFFGKKQV